MHMQLLHCWWCKSDKQWRHRNLPALTSWFTRRSRLSLKCAHIIPCAIHSNAGLHLHRTAFSSVPSQRSEHIGFTLYVRITYTGDCLSWERAHVATFHGSLISSSRTAAQRDKCTGFVLETRHFHYCTLHTEFLCTFQCVFFFVTWCIFFELWPFDGWFYESFVHG
jgi:hypothetical protein